MDTHARSYSTVASVGDARSRFVRLGAAWEVTRTAGLAGGAGGNGDFDVRRDACSCCLAGSIASGKAGRFTRRVGALPPRLHITGGSWAMSARSIA
ncbi:hypothetical protein SEVIR_7G184250v4 [Setaria viridis]